MVLAVFYLFGYSKLLYVSINIILVSIIVYIATDLYAGKLLALFRKTKHRLTKG